MRTRTLWRWGVLASGAAAAVLVVAGPASAHVTVNPSNATQGGFAKLTFRVPNEKDSATTTTLEVNLPAYQPIASVSVKPTTGWTATVTTTKLATPIKSDDGDVTEAVSKIVWKANSPDTAIQVGQFQEFDISAGPLPKTDKLVFKALQTYSDGDIVRWIDEPVAGGAEPDHPAPTVKLAAGADAAEQAAAPAGTAPAAAPKASSNGPALTLGIVALIAALAALAMSLLGWRRARPAVATAPASKPAEPAADSTSEPAGRK